MRLRLSLLCMAALTLVAACTGAEGAFFTVGDDHLAVTAESQRSGNANVDLHPDFQKVTFNLGTRRTGWNNARWAIAQFVKPRDLSKSGGLELVVATDKPRRDVGVHLALRDADGTWYVFPWAANLTLAVNRGTAPFEHFRTAAFWGPPGQSTDPDGKLNLSAITAVAVGCVDPTGAGVVEFSVRSITPVGAPSAPEAPVRVVVDGSALQVNAVHKVPVGIFGSFAMGKNDWDVFRLGARRTIVSQQGIGGTPQFGTPATPIHLNCVGERIHPSPRLTHRDWEERLRNTARDHARAAREKNEPLWVEFWNEPYLNWANRNRVNFDPALYDESAAVEGGPVTLKIDGQVAPHLRWTRQYDAPPWKWSAPQDWRRGRDDAGKVWSRHAQPYFYPRKQEGYHPETHPPVEVKDGQRYTVELKKLQRDETTGRMAPVPTGQKLELTAFTPWHVYDETQYDYWSGKGMLKFYVEPALAYGTALKKELPSAKFFVGWGMRPSENRWGAWEMLYQPTIDACIDIIDGYHDHDYGDDPLRMNAVYEVITAYGVTRHNKWLYGINTEQGPAFDSQAYPEQQRQVLAREARAEWIARKIMHALARIPDKALIHCHFAWDRQGDGFTYRLLRNLRGELLHVDVSDPEVYAVAAIDGTDPLAPRPVDMPPGKELVVAVLNDHTSPREVRFSLAAPKGTRLNGLVTRTLAKEPDGQLRIDEVAAEVDGLEHHLAVTIPPRKLIVLSYGLEGQMDAARRVLRKQYFSPVILKSVTSGADGEVRTSVDMNPKDLAGARRAHVRFVAERLAEGEGVLVLNGREYPLPSAITSDNGPWLRELQVDLRDLRQVNDLRFRTTGEAHAGYLVGSASLILESVTGPAIPETQPTRGTALPPPSPGNQRASHDGPPVLPGSDGRGSVGRSADAQ